MEQKFALCQEGVLLPRTIRRTQFGIGQDEAATAIPATRLPRFARNDTG